MKVTLILVLNIFYYNKNKFKLFDFSFVVASLLYNKFFHFYFCSNLKNLCKLRIYFIY